MKHCSNSPGKMASQHPAQRKPLCGWLSAPGSQALMLPSCPISPAPAPTPLPPGPPLPRSLAGLALSCPSWSPVPTPPSGASSFPACMSRTGPKGQWGPRRRQSWEQSEGSSGGWWVAGMGVAPRCDSRAGRRWGWGVSTGSAHTPTTESQPSSVAVSSPGCLSETGRKPTGWRGWGHHPPAHAHLTLTSAWLAPLRSW